MKIELYYAPLACSLVPFVTLREAGADFEVKTIQLRQQQQKRPEYLRINPKHKVPLLVVDGKPLSENLAIQTWIHQAFPKARLMPSDPWQQLQALSHLSWFASGFHPHMSRLNAPLKFCGHEAAQDSVAEIASAMLTEQFAIAETLLEGRDFFFDHFTAADAYFFWCFRRTKVIGLDLSPFKASHAHFEQMMDRPSVQHTLAFEATALEELKALQQ